MNEAGDLTDITPTSFTVGDADAVLKIGYGFGTYGSSAYGVANILIFVIQVDGIFCCYSLQIFGKNKRLCIVKY